MILCILLFLYLRESNQIVIRVTKHLSTSPKRGNPTNVFPNGTIIKLVDLFYALFLQC